MELAMPGSMRVCCSAFSRSQRWNSRVASRRAMNSTMPSRMRASEMRNCADLEAENSGLKPVADVGAREAPGSSRNGTASGKQQDVEPAPQHASKLRAAEVFQLEALLDQRAHAAAALGRLRHDAPDGDVQQPDDEDAGAGGEDLRDDEAAERDIAEHGPRRDDGEREEEKLEPVGAASARRERPGQRWARSSACAR